MNGSAISKRYADGFLEFARESMPFEKALEEMRAAKDIFRDNPDLVEFLHSPEIALSEKDEMVEKIFGGAFSQEMISFLELLLKKNRFDKFDHIAEYARMKYAHGDEVDAVLRVSYPMDTSRLEQVKGLLEKKFQKKVHMYMSLEPELLGGVSVTVGNMVIDGSVRKRLAEMKAKLLGIKVN